MTEFAGLLVTDDDKRILLARNANMLTDDWHPFRGIPAENGDEITYELPYVTIDEETFTVDALRECIAATYDLRVMVVPDSPPVTVRVRGWQTVCRLFRSSLSPEQPRLDNDTFRYVNLHSHGRFLPELPLGPYAQELRWKVQNHEETL